MTTISAADLTVLLEAADHAPSVHGTRPWRWEVTRLGVELVAEQDKRLPTTDPDGRDLVISCGAALYSLEVAAAAAGWRARTTRLPDPRNPARLATVRLDGHAATAEDRARAAALVERRTDRRAGVPWPVPAARLDQARRLAAQRGVLAVPLTSDDQRDVLLRLMAEAARLQERDLAYTIELSLRGHPRRPVDPHDTDASWVLLATASDDALSWLRAGEALQAMWLWAVENRFSLLPHTQVLEVSTTRRRLQQDLLEDRGCPQVVARVAWPPMESIGPTTGPDAVAAHAAPAAAGVPTGDG